MQREGGAIEFYDDSYLSVSKKNIHQLVDIDSDETFYRLENSFELMTSVKVIDEGYQKPDLENGEGNLCNVD